MVLRLNEGNRMISRAHFGSFPLPVSAVEINIYLPVPLGSVNTVHFTFPTFASK